MQTLQCSVIIIIKIYNGWMHAKYVYEYPTRSNDDVLALLQYLYMFRVPAVPIIRSTVLQLTDTGPNSTTVM
jgi:hypothetical protein